MTGWPQELRIAPRDIRFLVVQFEVLSPWFITRASAEQFLRRPIVSNAYGFTHGHWPGITGSGLVSVGDNGLPSPVSLPSLSSMLFNSVMPSFTRQYHKTTARPTSFAVNVTIAFNFAGLVRLCTGVHLRSNLFAPVIMSAEGEFLLTL